MDSSRTRRAVVASLLFLGLSAPLLAADAAKQELSSNRRAGELTRVEIGLQVGGDLKLVADGKPKDVPMSVVASLKYDEQILAADKGRATRSVRYYDDARAVIKIDKSGEKPSLDSSRRLIAVEKLPKSPAMLFCPTAALLREEVDLIDIPGNTLLLEQLLPNKPVANGESWKLDDETLANLLGLEAVSWSDVQSVVGETKDGLLEIAAAGSLSGAVGGISTEIELKAKYRFDLEARRVSYLAILIKEKRSVGHIGPGLDTVAKLLIEVKPLASSKRLTKAEIDKVRPMSQAQLALNYKSPQGNFQFDHERRWFVTSDDAKLTVLRYLDRGELIAQCNIASLPPDSKKALSLAEFQQDVQESLGKNFGQFVSASQNTTEAGYQVYRVVVHGKVSELPIQWVYYLIRDSKGHKASLSFTLEESLLEKFGQADRTLVSQLRLLEPPAPTAAKPADQPDTAKSTATKSAPAKSSKKR